MRGCVYAQGATYFHLTPEGKSSGFVLNHPPHAEMNERFSTEPADDGIGGWLPEGSTQMCAPAGSVIMYDSKTWVSPPALWLPLADSSRRFLPRLCKRCSLALSLSLAFSTV